MFNFVIECISLSIISLIIISIGYYIYDYYISINQKTNEENKSIEFKSEMNDININELEKLITKDEHEDEDEDDNNSNIKVEDTKNNEQNEDEDTIEKNEKEDEDTIEKNGKKYKIKKNNSLSSMDELDTIKLSLNKMLNDLNTKK